VARASCALAISGRNLSDWLKCLIAASVCPSFDSKIPKL
jgi:hypothetical protein